VAGWLREQGREVEEELIAGVYRIATTAKRPSVQLRARMYLIDHHDPVPRAPVVEVTTGPISVTWQASPSPTRPEPTRPRSTTPSGTNGHALPSSSVTDALENL
jgi:hypothetical protein